MTNIYIYCVLPMTNLKSSSLWRAYHALTFINNFNSFVQLIVTHQDYIARTCRRYNTLTLINNNNNNNNLDNFYGAVIQTQPIQGRHTCGSSDKCRASAKQLPTFRPSQPTWAVSPPVGCYDLHSPSPLLLLLLSPKADRPTHFVE